MAAFCKPFTTAKVRYFGHSMLPRCGTGLFNSKGALIVA